MSGSENRDGAKRKPRAPRVTVRCDAVLTEADGCEIDVVIVEVSSNGFKLQSREELVAGEVVMLKMQKQPPMRAWILWVRGLEAGGCFLDPVAL